MPEEIITQEQLDQIAEILKPAIRVVIEARPEQDLFIKITCTPLPQQPEAHVMLWQILLDGKGLTPEQEAKVTAFLRVAGSNAVPVKPGTT